MFDHVVLTASNESQAEAYRAELAHRGLGPRSHPAATVVPDPHGNRVGSGISTLLALHDLAQRWSRQAIAPREPTPGSVSPFAGKRVCIIHAGGDSRRLPAYAAHGKIFTPLPISVPNPRHAALFDLLLDDYSQIPLPDEGRVVVATGDVFLDIGAHRLGFDRPGIVGVAWASDPERGERHGVYRIKADCEVSGFLHKPSPCQAEDGGAVREDGTVLIDTGVVCLDPETAAQWLEDAGDLLERARGDAPPQVDLYGDILPALAHRRPDHGIDWARGTRFRAAVVPESPFLHIGSSRELLDALTGSQPSVAGWHSVPAAGPRARILHSRLDAPPRILGDRVLVESCALARAPALPGDNILVGVPPGLDRPIELPEGWGLVCLPIHDPQHADLWVAVWFGTTDDFKTPLHAGGTLGNRPMRALLERTGLDPEQLWRRDTQPGTVAETDRTLWTAHLWTPARAAAMLDLIAWIPGGGQPPTGWVESNRLSAAEVMAMVHHGRLLDARDRVLGCG